MNRPILYACFWIKLLTTLIVGTGWAQPREQSTSQPTYQNPVLPGFYPDPSICRLGEDYYLVTSSFEYFPALPLFHSKDLVHWQQLGHILNRPTQVPLLHASASFGLWAPTIRQYNGTFYVLCTNTKDGGNFMVTARDPRGPWSDPIWLDQGGIDPDLFVDDDSTAYLTTKVTDQLNQQQGRVTFEKRGIYQCRIDLRTGQRLSDTRLLSFGTNGGYVEAPHLYKQGNAYYLVVAEGGTSFGHMVSILKGPRPDGPFLPCPSNPILTHRHRNGHPVQATGHLDFVQTSAGDWWAVFLGIRINRGQFHQLGRETFLAPVYWPPGGWPVVGNNGTVELTMPGPKLANHPVLPEPVRTNFDANPLRCEWNFLRNPDTLAYSLTDRPGWLRIRATTTKLTDELGSLAWVGRRQQHLTATVTARVDLKAGSPDDEAGLTVWLTPKFHYRLSVAQQKRGLVVRVSYQLGEVRHIAKEIPVAAGPLLVRVSATPAQYTFSYSTDDSRFTELTSMDSRFLSPEVAWMCFTGVYYGLYAEGKTATAFVDWFDYKPVE